VPPEIQLNGVAAASFDVPLLAVALAESPDTSSITELDAALGGSLKRAIDGRDFRGARDEALHFSGLENGPRRVVLVGMGKIQDRAGSLRRAAAVAARQARKLGSAHVALYAGSLTAAEVEAVAVGLLAGGW
jgi:leucyl aminopeptidase